MNSVDKVKAICKERKIPISKIEKELGFSNGYIGQLRKGTFPADRLALIANYLGVTTEYLLGYEQKEKSPSGEEGLSELQKEAYDFIMSCSVDDLKNFIKYGRFMKENGV
jgi:transcriptional regulator with XRE-family HTH domain